MFFLLYDMLFAQLSLCLPGVGELVVPLRCMLAVQVFRSDLVQGLQLLILQLYSAGQVPLSHVLDGVLVGLDQVQLLHGNTICMTNIERGLDLIKKCD